MKFFSQNFSSPLLLLLIIIIVSSFHSFLSSIQRECFLAILKYHLGVSRGQSVSAAGGLTVLQQRKRLSELSPPERYLEQSKPLPEVQSTDFEVRPIDEGILLSSSALQMLSAVTTLTTSMSGVAVDSAVLYSTGYVLQLSGAGVFDSMWILKGEDEDELFLLSSATNNGNRRVSLVLSNGNTVSGLGSADSSDIVLETVREKGLEPDSGEFPPPDELAVDARHELALQTQRAIAARRFGVAAIGAGALVAAYGCRQNKSAVCWLLQLQR